MEYPFGRALKGARRSDGAGRAMTTCVPCALRETGDPARAESVEAIRSQRSSDRGCAMCPGFVFVADRVVA
jgi:hypothetical protein